MKDLTEKLILAQLTDHERSVYRAGKAEGRKVGFLKGLGFSILTMALAGLLGLAGIETDAFSAMMSFIVVFFIQWRWSWLQS